MSLYSRAEKVMRPALCSETAMDFLQEADAALAIKDAEIARLREALTSLLGAKCWEDDIAASTQARAALAQVAEVGK